MSTNIKESGFEELFTENLIQNGFVQKFYSGANQGDYDRSQCIDLATFWSFIETSQPKEVEKLKIAYGTDYRNKFISRVQKEIADKGIIQVLRK